MDRGAHIPIHAEQPNALAIHALVAAVGSGSRVGGIELSRKRKVLRSRAFLHSRERSAAIAEDPDKLRALADSVATLDHLNPPLAVIADHLVAADRFLRARAMDLETKDSASANGSKAVDLLTGRSPSAGVATRERLLVASLDYLVTPVDLVPDFRPGGYIDDVALLAWVFGVTTSELAPYLHDDPDDIEPASVET